MIYDHRARGFKIRARTSSNKTTRFATSSDEHGGAVIIVSINTSKLCLPGRGREVRENDISMMVEGW